MKHHSMNIRVYYEDTDLGGVVYYANYLRFIERARSEWIRELGIDQIKMRNEEEAIFVVTKIKADYLSPAHFDDILTVDTKIKVVSPVRAYFYQNIFREEKVMGGYLTRLLPIFFAITLFLFGNSIKSHLFLNIVLLYQFNFSKFLWMSNLINSVNYFLNPKGS